MWKTISLLFIFWVTNHENEKVQFANDVTKSIPQKAMQLI